MSNETDFAACEAAIRAIDTKNAKSPPLPPGVFSQEAEDLAVLG